MELSKAKEKFIESWGALGSSWGISKTMAQVHALLLVSNEPLSAEDVMNQLGISRGNANLNLRALIDWELVERESKIGERKEFFAAEKDIWQVATKIANERRKRELAPVLRVLDQVKEVDPESGDAAEVSQFLETVENIENFSRKVDSAFERMTKADKHWFTGTLLKIVKK